MLELLKSHVLYGVEVPAHMAIVIMCSHAVPDKCQFMELWQNLHRQYLHILEYLLEALLLSLLLGAGVGAVDT